jgi:drug/metabolite transporter (DMT)-like permease
MTNLSASPPGQETDLLLNRSSLHDQGSSSDEQHDNESATSSHRRKPSRLEVISEGVDHMMEVVGDVTTHFYEDAVEVKDAVQEALAEEVSVIADMFMEELHEADDGNTFLEFSLTRNFSILPTDIERAVDVANLITTGADDIPSLDDKLGLIGTDIEIQTLELIKEAEETVAAAVTTPTSAYLLLALAVFSLSAIGPLLQAQKDVDSTMKICWRQFATSCLLLPFAVVSVSKDGFPQMASAQWFTFLLASVCYTIMCVGFSLSLEYTAVGNAVILCNSQSLLLLAGKLFVGHHVSSMEATGAFVAFCGAIFCSIDSSQSAPVSVGGKTFLGDFLAILSAIGGVGYLIFAKQTRSHMNLYVFMYLNMLTGSVITLSFMSLILREPFTFDRNEATGVFGWINMDADRLPLEMAMVIWCNFFGALGYVRAMQFFDNLVLCVAALMEPAVAELMAFSIGVGFLPGWKGWLGNGLVAVGTFAVVYRPHGSDKVASSH